MTDEMALAIKIIFFSIYCIIPICICPLVYAFTTIYIVIHRQTVSFYQNSSVWLDTQDARSRDRNPSNFPLDCVSDHSSTKRTTLAKGILRYILFLETAAAAFVYIFYTLSATRVLNSFEELCITQAVAGNPFARELNPHGGAYIYILLYTCIYMWKVSKVGDLSREWHEVSLLYS